ncbi:MAG: type II secretion system protein [Chloroflexi bacterium]|nr:type II secretion system protein [Chloroflexota bacterium]
MKTNSGFTLIEYLVTIAIVAILGAGGAATIFHVLRVSQQNSQWSVVVRQAQSAGYWISQDVLEASTIDTADDPGTPETEVATMRWKHWETGEAHTIRYSRAPSSGSLYKLQRSESVINNDGSSVSNNSREVADNIDSVSVASQADGSWKLTVNARSGSRYVVREYVAEQRPNYNR